MYLKKIFTGIFLFLLCGGGVHAQSITGTWEGQIVDDGEFLQINIVQVGDKLCGYTWDYVLDDPESYCKAYFTGSLVQSGTRWLLNGTDFIENSGSHVLMQMLVSTGFEKGRPVMNGYLRIKPKFDFGAGDPNIIKLYKVSKKPAMMTETMKNCVVDNTPAKKPVKRTPVVPKIKPVPPVVKPVIPEKPVPPVVKPVIIKKPVPPVVKPVIPKIKDTVARKPLPVHKDTVVYHPPQPVIIAPVVKPLPLKTAGRNNREIRSITVHQKKIRLYVYDNAEVDGDSVSIYYNGRQVASHIRLAEKPFILDIDLDPTVALHSIVMFAENLGSIPPNTALLIFTDDAGKRYEVFSSATLDQNAELVFKYEP